MEGNELPSELPKVSQTVDLKLITQSFAFSCFQILSFFTFVCIQIFPYDMPGPVQACLYLPCSACRAIYLFKNLLST